jgi:transposase
VAASSDRTGIRLLAITDRRGSDSLNLLRGRACRISAVHPRVRSPPDHSQARRVDNSPAVVARSGTDSRFLPSDRRSRLKASRCPATFGSTERRFRLCCRNVPTIADLCRDGRSYESGVRC